MKAISFVNMKGGVGKSTLAVNFAWCLALEKNKKVALIDLDPQFNATQCLLNPNDYMNHKKSDKDTVANIFDEQAFSVSSVSGVNDKTNKNLEDIELLKLHSNFYLLPGDLMLHRIEMVQGRGTELRLRNYLKNLESQNLDFVIIDTPPTPSIWMSSALIASDYYIIALKPEPLSTTGVDLLEGLIKNQKENYQLELQCLGIALNMAEPTTITYKKSIETLNASPWNNLVFKSYIPKATGIAREQTAGKHILTLDNNSLRTALITLTEEILEQISNKD